MMMRKKKRTAMKNSFFQKCISPDYFDTLELPLVGTREISPLQVQYRNSILTTINA